MYKPNIKVNKDNGIYNYTCFGISDIKGFYRHCRECTYFSKCEINSCEFIEYYWKYGKCNKCKRRLHQFYVYIMYKIRDYLPSDFEFLCCKCYAIFG